MNFVEKVGLQLYSIKDETGKDFLETLEKVAAMGYKNVEFAGFFDTPAEVLKETLDRLSLTAISSHTGMTLLLEDLDGMIAYHKTIGAKNLVVPWAKFETLEDVKNMADSLNKIAPKIHDAGLELGYHNHATEFIKFDGEYGLDILMELTQKSNVFPQVDTFWAAYAGVDPVDYISKYPGRCKMIHLKDMKIKGEKQQTEVGNGIIDTKGLIKKGLEIGIEYFIVEQENFDKPTLDACNISLRNLERIGKELS